MSYQSGLGALATVARYRRTRLTAAVALTLALASGAPIASAANIVVGACSENNLTVNGHPFALGLRPAIMSAASGDVIDMTGLSNCTITLTQGELPITVSKLEIDGPSGNPVTINANAASRILHHTGTGLLTLNSLALTGGFSGSADVPANQGGGILSAGGVSLIAVSVKNCQAGSGGGGIAAVNSVSTNASTISNNFAPRGGGILASTADTIHGISLVNSTVSGNTGGGISTAIAQVTSSFVTGNIASDQISGGGVSAHDVTLAYSTVSGNQAGAAGGVYASHTLSASYSTISGNTATTFAGGIMSCALNNYLQCVGSSATIAHSTIDNNVSGAIGGGFFGSNATFVDSTISGNTANQSAGIYAAGIYHGTGLLELDNSTIAFNRSSDRWGGILIAATTSAHVVSSILAKNSEGVASTGADLYAYGSASLSVATSLIISTNRAVPHLSADPQLVPLSNHGGFTRTHALLASSPAVDHGSVTGANPPTSDQRSVGFARNVGAAPDIGAYERQALDDEIFYNGFQ